MYIHVHMYIIRMYIRTYTHIQKSIQKTVLTALTRSCKQPLSDQGNDKNYTHHTHIHTVHHSTPLSYSLLVLFFFGVVVAAAPHICMCEPFHVSAYVCVCVFVCEL